MSDKEELPIHHCRKELEAALQANSSMIVVGETGSGKTTQLPQILAAMALSRPVGGKV